MRVAAMAAFLFLALALPGCTQPEAAARDPPTFPKTLTLILHHDSETGAAPLETVDYELWVREGGAQPILEEDGFLGAGQSVQFQGILARDDYYPFDFKLGNTHFWGSFEFDQFCRLETEIEYRLRFHGGLTDLGRGGSSEGECHTLESDETVGPSLYRS